MAKHLPHHAPHSHHTHSSHASGRPASVLATRSQVSKRRSNRMGLNAAVGLSGQDRHKTSFTTDAKAINLNRHGAAVQLRRELLVGSTVVIRHPQRGMEVPARIVSLIAAVEGLCTYGVEFVEQDDRAKNFWGISFPSA